MGGHPGRITLGKHPGEHPTPCEPSRECISPQGGAMGPWALGQPPVGCPRQLEVGCPRQLEMVAVFIGTVPFGSHGHPKGRGIEKLFVPGAQAPMAPP